MTSENKTWESLKAGYLQQVREALSSAGHPRSEEIIEDVRSHLDRRFAELEADWQTWENFQAIITEMGPACDYAELLEPNTTLSKQVHQEKFLVYLGVAAVVIVIGILLSIFILREPKPVAPEKFRRSFLEKHDNFDIDSASLADVKKALGNP